jgi:hypothetical protein
VIPIWAIVLIVIVGVIVLGVGAAGVWMSVQDGNADQHRAREAERRREWERWSRRGSLYRASLQFRDMQPWLRVANNLPPKHDESQYHD